MRIESIATKRLLTSDDFESWVSDPVIITIVWVVIMVLVLICPFVVTRQRRTLCYRRITERTWNVEGVEVPPILPTSHVFERTYPIGDPRRRYTKEDADIETEKFIKEKLAPFTKIIDENDFIKDDYDVEMGQKDNSLAETQQQPENLAEGTEKLSEHSLDENPKSIAKDLSSTFGVVDQEAVNGDEKDDEERGNKDDGMKNIDSQELAPTTEGLLKDEGHLSISSKQAEQNPSIDDEKEDKDSIKKSVEFVQSPYRKEKRVKAIKLPGPGVSSQGVNCLSCTNSVRGDVERQCLSTECSICLDAFALGEKVCWSALDCEHIFHHACIVEWLTTLGKKSNHVAENSHSTTVMQSRLCNFSMVCPVCRKDFIPNAADSS